MSREEPHIIQALIDLFYKMRITCVIQVGAEDGYEADELRKATGCHAVCIEPDPKCDPVSTKLDWHEVIIGAENSIVNFYINGSIGLSSKYPRSDAQEMLACMPQIRLDKFCEKHRIKPDALIIDVEGTSMDVLHGCGNLLDDIKIVYCEVCHDDSRGPDGLAVDVDAYLTERGFKRSMELPTYRAGGQSNWTFIR